METTQQRKRIWIAHRPYNQEVRVVVHYSPIDGLWTVEQGKREVIRCSHLCLRDVEFDHITWKIMGFIATFKELRDMHDVMGHDENTCFETVSVESCKDGYCDELNIFIDRCPYLDMVSYDHESMLAIYPN